MRADRPPWLRCFEEELPTHVVTEGSLEAGEGAWIAELAGALYCVAASLDDAALGELKGRLALDPAVRRRLRRAASSPRAPTPQAEVVGLLGRVLAERLSEGFPVSESLRALVAEVPSGASLLCAYEGWESVSRAVAQLSLALTYVDVKRDTPRSRRCRNAWLGWMHGRSKRRRGPRSRTYHMARFLLLVTGSAAVLSRADLLAGRLLEREAPPFGADEVMRGVMLRQPLRAGRQDIRSVPLARLAASWATLSCSSAPVDEALHDLAAVLFDARDLVWERGLAPPVAFQRRGDEVSLAAARERRAADTVWVGDLVSAGLPTPSLTARQRVLAAYAHALHESADNTAMRWMPSLGLWPRFRAAVAPWAREHAAILRHVEGDAGARWRLCSADGQPWSASRLFDACVTALVEGDPERLLRRSRFVCSQPELAAAVPDLLRCLREFCVSVEQSPEIRRAREREIGLRWQSPLPWQQERREAKLEIGPDASPGDGAVPLPCAHCAELDERWAARRALLGPAPLAREGRVNETKQEIHRRFHAQPASDDSSRGHLLREAAWFYGTFTELLARVWLGEVSSTEGLAGLEQGLEAAAAPRGQSDSPTPIVSSSPWCELDLRVEGASVQVRVRTPSDDRREAGPFPPADARLLWAVEEAAEGLARGDHGTAIARLAGEALMELLPASVRELILDALAIAPPRVNLQIERPWDALPWELLAAPGPPGVVVSLMENAQLCRVLPGPLAPGAVDPQRPTLLFAHAQVPHEAVQEELAAARAWAEVHLLPDATRDKLGAALARGPYAVLHLACHGEPGRLLLADGPVQERALASWARNRVTRFALLHLCWGATGLRAPVSGYNWSGLGGRLIEAGVPSVIGVSAPLANAEAGVLARALYGALSRGRDLGAAVSQARRALHDALPGSPVYGLVRHLRGGPAPC